MLPVVTGTKHQLPLGCVLAGCWEVCRKPDIAISTGLFSHKCSLQLIVVQSVDLFNALGSTCCY